MKINQTTQERLKEINKAGSIATKTRITMATAEKNAEESAAVLKRPSKFVQKMASAFNKLNVF
ncbi:hypothetical protein [Halobacteriovorax sp. JY17]|uniref:hypothetical protein n=1 Tax=Halobacteriovorax sp. JY17 TaxID=2014617 RepID=UPI000C4A1B40|nr:hypothetical protein [Halobacteriovorax sp. JY17]PIK14583.1 MAG: hypothetical protein CES88_09595 [Halobacteriovorax sp. JY17]